MRRASVIAASASALLAWLAPIGAAAVNVVGTSAGLSWTAATGPVSGYAVQVSRNGGSYAEVARVATLSTRVSGQIGDTLLVRIAAFDVNGRMGAASTPSDPITFTQSAPPPPPPPPPPPAPPPGGGDPGGDVDGDGLTDALVFNSKSNELSALLLRSNGTREWQSIGIPSDPGMRPVGYADANGDGQGDLLWRNAASGTNELWLMNGSTYSTVALPDQPARFGVKAFRDFSGDGLADAFFHDANAGDNEIWTLGAAGRSSVLAVDPAPSGASLAAVADVDGDGAPDFVWHDPLTGVLEGWRMLGAAPVAIFSLPNAPSGAVAEGSGDLDGDGDDDLVWRVRQGKLRTLNVWFMDGMNAPAQGIAGRIKKKTLVRGVVDVTSDGRAEIMVVSKGGFIATTVDATGSQNAAGEMEWTTDSVNLTQVPAPKRWRFLVLE
jgi:FG-GAP-like repeat